MLRWRHSHQMAAKNSVVLPTVAKVDNHGVSFD